MIRVAVASSRDALHTLNLHREAIAEGRWFVRDPDEFGLTIEGRDHEISLLNAAVNGCFLVARLVSGPDDEALPVRVAGFVSVNGGGLRRTRHVGRVEIVVGGAHRGKGVGRALMEGAIAWAAASGVVRKLSLAVLADNAAAVALYRRCGFVEEGRRTAEYCEPDGRVRDDLLMARPI